MPPLSDPSASRADPGATVPGEPVAPDALGALVAQRALRAAEPRSTNAVNALVHLYRAEVGRLTAYRVRLDTSTNWAITTSALVISLTLGNPQIPHVAMLLLMLADYFFLQLEARRFRAYEASRHRVHLLERFFYPEVLDEPVNPRWTEQLLDALRNPGLSVNLLGALGWRLRRNYLWIHAAVLIAWIGILDLRGGPLQQPGELVERAAYGLIP
ncbi:MAG: hypothetical protein QOF51_3813, partial [Chloroflexota bacterium]|nr:hypothetical protein [Chloroflexota bacterium]